jgi:3-methyladenine DNA glycosylase AlkC
MAEPFKHRFFQRPFFERLAAAVARAYPPFDRGQFFARVYDDVWDGLELKGRLRHATEALGATLPGDYLQALAVLLAVEREFDGFDHLLFADFVERFGVDHVDASLDALEVFTRSSAEFAVRPFIRRYPEAAFARVLAWTTHASEHVRRLSSEGCRPRLPWGTALTELKRDPSPLIPILERLKDDPSDYVRRSVANNLGDIAKDHPALAVRIARRWVDEDERRRPLVKHALRDLLKKGDRAALRLFGVDGRASVRVVTWRVKPGRIALGGRAALDLRLASTAKTSQALRLEYAITYARPGGRSARKVFKLAEVRLAAGAVLTLARTLDFRDRTIRMHHGGPHAAALIINGRPAADAPFRLVSAPTRATKPPARRRTSAD